MEIRSLIKHGVTSTLLYQAHSRGLYTNANVHITMPHVLFMSVHVHYNIRFILKLVLMLMLMHTQMFLCRNNYSIRSNAHTYYISTHGLSMLILYM